MADDPREDPIADRLERSFDVAEAGRCLKWIKELTDAEEITNDLTEECTSEQLYDCLHDGMVLCKLVNVLMPDSINFESKMFQTTGAPVFVHARERERIAVFSKYCMEYGVPSEYLFQTEALYERTNVGQVCIAIRAVGIEAQMKDDYAGPMDPPYWPKKNEKNTREFTEEQLVAGRTIIGLQMGTNKGANASGLSFGRHRMIMD